MVPLVPVSVRNRDGRAQKLECDWRLFAHDIVTKHQRYSDGRLGFQLFIHMLASQVLAGYIIFGGYLL